MDAAVGYAKLIGLGCVECRFEKIDTPEEIVARVEEAMRYVEPERLSLNPDCGFAPGLRSEVPLDEAYLKLRNEAEAARRLRDMYP
jgi:5-methyltetrahydropteroyltriglutamate--homocysteine methyltransferase